MTVDVPLHCLPPAIEGPAVDHVPAALLDVVRAGIEAGREPVELLARLVTEGHLDDVPLPGAGRTARRFRLLAEISATDLSLGRLVEGHLDAVAILAEAGRAAQPGCYGVWAAERPGGAIHAELGPLMAGRERCWTLSGVKPYASGAGRLDVVLLTAVTAGGPRLFEVHLHGSGAKPLPDTWPAVGMADSLSGSVSFDGVTIPADAALGEPGFYTARPGFWAGSIGVAACWYGGGLGVHRSLAAALGGGVGGRATAPAYRQQREPDPHQLSHLGATAARCRALATELSAAAAALDADPLDAARSSRVRALTVRHLVYEGCLEILDRAGRAGRTAFLTGDRSVARRMADLPVYLSQHHPDDDLRALGVDALDQERDPLIGDVAPAFGALDAGALDVGPAVREEP